MTIVAAVMKYHGLVTVAEVTLLVVIAAGVKYSRVLIVVEVTYHGVPMIAEMKVNGSRGQTLWGVNGSRGNWLLVSEITTPQGFGRSRGKAYDGQCKVSWGINGSRGNLFPAMGDSSGRGFRVAEVREVRGSRGKKVNTS